MEFSYITFFLGGENIFFLQCIFVFLVCFVLQIVVFNEFIGFCVIFCMYEDILKILLNIFRKNKCQSVNNSRTNYFFVIFWDFLY